MTVRVYAAADAAALRALASDEPVVLDLFTAASADEEDEFDAVLVVAETGPVVITAEVEDPDGPVHLRDLQALHLDADGSGDLAWYGPTEIDQVIALLT